MTHGVSLPGIADNGWPKLGREIRFWAELRCKRMVIEQDDIETRREEDWTRCVDRRTRSGYRGRLVVLSG